MILPHPSGEWHCRSFSPTYQRVFTQRVCWPALRPLQAPPALLHPHRRHAMNSKSSSTVRGLVPMNHHSIPFHSISNAKISDAHLNLRCHSVRHRRSDSPHTARLVGQQHKTITSLRAGGPWTRSASDHTLGVDKQLRCACFVVKSCVHTNDRVNGKQATDFHEHQTAHTAVEEEGGAREQWV
jgi:hypothetical protein